jgi:hypothetical protein
MNSQGKTLNTHTTLEETRPIDSIHRNNKQQNPSCKNTDTAAIGHRL